MASPNTHLPTDLVRISEAATRAGLNVMTVYRRIQKGKLPVYGCQQSYRVSLSDVLPVSIRKSAKQ